MKLMATGKLILVGITIGTFFILHALRILVSKLLFSSSHFLADKITSISCRILLKIIGVCIHIEKHVDKRDKKNYLYVSNHLSYLDVLIYYSYFPCTFVTSKEIKETPFLGHICMMADCFFVERRSKKNLIKEINSLSDILAKRPVMIFPEATSTDGKGVLPFKSPLFKACTKKEISVLPLTINYKKIDHTPFNLYNRDVVCWYGDMSFAPHFWRLLQCRLIEVEIVVSPSLYHPDHRQLAKNSYKLISSSYISWSHS